MKTAEIRNRLHQYIDAIEDKKVKAIYTILEDGINEHVNDYTQEFMNELDARYEEYKNGGKLINEADANTRIRRNFA